MAICQYLTVDELCSIYDKRPTCCRNFPNRNNIKCIDSNRCDLNCEKCTDKCCKHIYIYDKNVISSLNIKCNDCNQVWD